MNERFILGVETEAAGGGYFTEVDSPIEDSEGRPLSRGLPGRPLEVFEIREGLDVRSASPGYLPVKPSGRYGDLLWYRLRGNLFLSDHALSALDAAGIQFDEWLHRWPVLLVDASSRAVIDSYQALWAVKRHEVLDRERSEIEYMVNGRTILHVRKWVFNEAATPDREIFSTEATRVVVSDRFRQVAVNAGLTGMKFTPVG